MITQERLKQVLSYEPETGLFTWLVATGSRCKAGKIAGGVREGGYVVIRIDGELNRAHRLAWLYVHGEWPANGLDHINGVTSDNRIANLRDVPPAHNAQNVKDGPLIGVERRPSGHWRAVLKMGSKKLNLGTYQTQEEARAAYLQAKSRLHPGYVESRAKYPSSTPAA